MDDQKGGGGVAMKTRLWIVLLVVVAWTSFLIGYSVSALTGTKGSAGGAAAGGGYGVAAGGSGAGAGGYGAPAGGSGAGAGGYGAPAAGRGSGAAPGAGVVPSE